MLHRLILNMFLVTACLVFPALQAAENPTVLITGSNRGIGLEIARIYAERGWTVIATARRPEATDDLKAIRVKHPNLVIEQLDVTDHARIDALAAQYRDKPIDILINNAGISGGHENAKFGEMNYDVYYEVHRVNVIGPTKMAEAFLPSVVMSEQKKIINITSGQGSIAKTWGCCTIYRSSKAALNMMMRNISLELKKKGITVGLISPGFVKTGFTPGLDLPMMITPVESATKVVAVIDEYDLEDTGTFLGKDGQTWPW
ncbi:MAG: SDR family oxidoreductase [Gammaproteobacteria bacterium]|jgi:NAD(P)-dependent dehydrogenase (short-subunit alcohol dehydrogenase family)|nr:short-chain dehydrogenase [Chromatiales bacterium]MDP6673722.1 SDR family oxidoreductase [Gammaproteobacteria bacterium]